MLLQMWMRFPVKSTAFHFSPNTSPRRAGQPICAAVSGEHRGYFIGDAEELRLYLHSLDRRLREVRRTRDAIVETLRRESGQMVLEGWNG